MGYVNARCLLAFHGSVNCTEGRLAGKKCRGGTIEASSARRVRALLLYCSEGCIAERSTRRDREPRAAWLTLWATDIGDAIEVVASASADKYLPLSEVTLELRSGGTRTTATRTSLFDQGNVCRLSWHIFENARLASQAARVLSVRAKTRTGEAINGIAFVDDLATLTSEPMHRGAWRAALSLLSSETLPEYSDIAALFQLVEDVVTTDEEQEGGEDPTGGQGSGLGGSTKTITEDKSPVWPPEPITADLTTVSVGHTTGDIYWFNRILASLVQKSPRDDNSRAEPQSVANAEDEETVEEEPVPQVVSACERIWERAFDGLCNLEDKLLSLELTKANARKIWGPSAFMLGDVKFQLQHGSIGKFRAWTRRCVN